MNLLYTEQWSREVPLNKTSKVWSLQATNRLCSNELSILPKLGHRITEGKGKLSGKTLSNLPASLATSRDFGSGPKISLADASTS
ncbi:UNVERIFIED_CONTAM: hypothetical protein Sradi_6193400 [Sesamum radiatum]|uniref:Uncharacterized protein n=1 Tax=Sesamum radiatum TaxID=300843 RepID=A0AAW2KA39_SESRA